jgi:hypothetical protein
MMTVDIGDCWLSLEIRTGRGTRGSDRWRCVQALGSTSWRPRGKSRNTLKYVDNETNPAGPSPIFAGSIDFARSVQHSVERAGNAGTAGDRSSFVGHCCG